MSDNPIRDFTDICEKHGLVGNRRYEAPEPITEMPVEIALCPNGRCFRNHCVCPPQEKESQMPLYVVSEQEQPDRLVKAASAEAALRHAARPRFSARLVKNPAEVAELMGGGLLLEKAGEEPAPTDVEPDAGAEEAE